jgi:prevent-host-death family protein
MLEVPAIGGTPRKRSAPAGGRWVGGRWHAIRPLRTVAQAVTGTGTALNHALQIRARSTILTSVERSFAGVNERPAALTPPRYFGPVMPKVMNLYDAKAQLSRLIDRATAGEDIVIGRPGKPLVRLVPAEGMRPREPGLLKDVVVPAC